MAAVNPALNSMALGGMGGGFGGSMPFNNNSAAQFHASARPLSNESGTTTLNQNLNLMGLSGSTFSLQQQQQRAQQPWGSQVGLGMNQQLGLMGGSQVRPVTHPPTLAASLGFGQPQYQQGQQGGWPVRPQTTTTDPSWQFKQQQHDTNSLLQSLMQGKNQGLAGGRSNPFGLTGQGSLGGGKPGSVGRDGSTHSLSRPDSNHVYIKAEHKSSEHELSSGDDEGGENSSGRIRGSQHQRQLTVQEKNRSAQRRFRQRQKEKMAFLEKQVDSLSKQVDGLCGENSSVKNLNNILEKVLNLRDEHISNLQEAAKVFSYTDELVSVDLSGSHMLPPSIACSPARFSVETIRGMTFDDVLDCWKENLKELSKCVWRVGGLAGGRVGGGGRQGWTRALCLSFSLHVDLPPPPCPPPSPLFERGVGLGGSYP